jgi:hypothetical protein
MSLLVAVTVAVCWDKTAPLMEATVARVVAAEPSLVLVSPVLVILVVPWVGQPLLVAAVVLALVVVPAQVLLVVLAVPVGQFP